MSVPTPPCAMSHSALTWLWCVQVDEGLERRVREAVAEEGRRIEAVVDVLRSAPTALIHLRLPQDGLPRLSMSHRTSCVPGALPASVCECPSFPLCALD